MISILGITADIKHHFVFCVLLYTKGHDGETLCILPVKTYAGGSGQKDLQALDAMLPGCNIKRTVNGRFRTVALICARLGLVDVKNAPESS